MEELYDVWFKLPNFFGKGVPSQESVDIFAPYVFEDESLYTGVLVGDKRRHLVRKIVNKVLNLGLGTTGNSSWNMIENSHLDYFLLSVSQSQVGCPKPSSSSTISNLL